MLHGNNSYLPKKDDDNELPTEDVDAKAKLRVTSVSECPIVAPGLQITKLPRTDLKRFVLRDQVDTRPVNISFDRRTLLGAADPSMLQSIHKLTKQWKLNAFHGITSEPHPIENYTSTIMPLDKFGTNRHEVETHLAAHALLSLLTKQLICALVSHGLDVSNRDKAKGLSSIPPRRRKSQVADSMRMLSPTHVLSGMLTRGLGREANKHPVDGFLLFGLSRLGVTVDDDGCDGGRKGSKIKVEDAA